MRQAVAQWDALQLEEAIIAAGGAGGMVRSMAEWAKYPQAAAIAALPLLMEIVKIGDSAPEPLPEGERPLSGIRVFDLTRVLAGPTSARTLAEHGADVMKITAQHLPNIGYQEYDTGHGNCRRISICVNRATSTPCSGWCARPTPHPRLPPGGRRQSRPLPEELAKLRPGLVYVSMCAFSHAGPWASRRGFDTVVQTVKAGSPRAKASCFRRQPRPAVLPGFYRLLNGVSDGVWRMVALARRAREGGSWLVRISLAQTGRWLVDRGQVAEAELKDVGKELYPRRNRALVDRERHRRSDGCAISDRPCAAF